MISHIEFCLQRYKFLLKILNTFKWLCLSDRIFINIVCNTVLYCCFYKFCVILKNKTSKTFSGLAFPFQLAVKGDKKNVTCLLRYWYTFNINLSQQSKNQTINLSNTHVFQFYSFFTVINCKNKNIYPTTNTRYN